MAAPTVGAIVDGYRFLGGDPNDQASWQPAGVEEIAQAKAQGAALGKAGPKVVDQNGFNAAAVQLKDLRGARDAAGFLNTGLIGALSAGNEGVWKGIPGTPGYNLNKELGTIKARIMLANMRNMQRQSPTGSTGMGQLSNAEGETLRSTVAPLDVGLPAGELRQNLDRVREDTIRNQPGLVVDNPYDLSGGQSRSTIPRGAYYRDPQGNIRRNDHGDDGNPIIKPAAPKAAAATPAPSGVDPKVWAHMTPQERALWN